MREKAASSPSNVVAFLKRVFLSDLLFLLLDHTEEPNRSSTDSDSESAHTSS